MQHRSRSGRFDGAIVKRLSHRQLCNIAYLIENRSIDHSSRPAANLAAESCKKTTFLTNVSNGVADP